MDDVTSFLEHTKSFINVFQDLSIDRNSKNIGVLIFNTSCNEIIST